jgi:hypothetical protein
MDSHVTVQRCDITSNTAVSGAGVCASSVHAHVEIDTHTSIAYNVASQGGGGVAVESGANAMMAATIDHNTAPTGAGVLVQANSIVTLHDNARLTYNTGTIGGGLLCEGSLAQVEVCVCVCVLAYVCVLTSRHPHSLLSPSFCDTL